MDLHADVSIPFPRPVVFAAYRDRLLELVPYLPNIRRIEVRSRSDEPPLTRVVNIWHGGGEIPAAARAFLSESMLSWTDHATWNQAAWTCDWRIETHAFTEAVHCAGRNHFAETPEGTRLEFRGELRIDPGKLRGVPGFLGKKVAGAVEQLLVSRIRPNLVETGQGLARLLQAGG